MRTLGRLVRGFFHTVTRGRESFSTPLPPMVWNAGGGVDRSPNKMKQYTPTNVHFQHPRGIGTCNRRLDHGFEIGVPRTTTDVSTSAPRSYILEHLHRTAEIADEVASTYTLLRTDISMSTGRTGMRTSLTWGRKGNNSGVGAGGVDNTMIAAAI
jgi:hypothetical protein